MMLGCADPGMEKACGLGSRSIDYYGVVSFAVRRYAMRRKDMLESILSYISRLVKRSMKAYFSKWAMVCGFNRFGYV